MWFSASMVKPWHSDVVWLKYLTFFADKYLAHRGQITCDIYVFACT